MKLTTRSKVKNLILGKILPPSDLLFLEWSYCSIIDVKSHVVSSQNIYCIIILGQMGEPGPWLSWLCRGKGSKIVHAPYTIILLGKVGESYQSELNISFHFNNPLKYLCLPNHTISLSLVSEKASEPRYRWFVLLTSHLTSSFSK